jgi:hypothetical protein
VLTRNKKPIKKYEIAVKQYEMAGHTPVVEKMAASL